MVQDLVCIWQNQLLSHHKEKYGFNQKKERVQHFGLVCHLQEWKQEREKSQLILNFEIHLDAVDKKINFYIWLKKIWNKHLKQNLQQKNQQKLMLNQRLTILAMVRKIQL